MICLISMLVTSISILLTDSIIKIFFKIKSIQKPRIQNTIRFKTLNLAYGFGLLGTSVLHLIVLEFDSKDTYIVHYTVSLVVNSILFSFIYANQDTLTYLKMKRNMLLNQRNLNYRTEMNSFEQQREVGPWMKSSNRNRMNADRNRRCNLISPGWRDQIYVIDIEE